VKPGDQRLSRAGGRLADHVVPGVVALNEDLRNASAEVRDRLAVRIAASEQKDGNARLGKPWICSARRFGAEPRIAQAAARAEARGTTRPPRSTIPCRYSD
jgi:hypothetical protein